MYVSNASVVVIHLGCEIDIFCPGQEPYRGSWKGLPYKLKYSPTMFLMVIKYSVRRGNSPVDNNEIKMLLSKLLKSAVPARNPDKLAVGYRPDHSFDVGSEITFIGHQ